MDFNTGRDSGRSDDRPLFGGDTGRPTGRPPRGPAGSPGGEFNRSDPVNSFIGTVRNLVLDPIGFFRGIPRRGDFVNPLIFALICAVIYALLGGILGVIISPFSAGPGDTGEALVVAIVGLVTSLVLTPILSAIGLFVGAGITHLLVMLLVRPDNAGYEATFRVGAYASVILLVAWLAVIPILGILVAIVMSVYSIFLAIVGIREVHSTTTGRAALVVLIPVVAILLLLFILVGGVLLVFLLGSEQQF
jgi:hypothetical protein